MNSKLNRLPFTAFPIGYWLDIVYVADEQNFGLQQNTVKISKITEDKIIVKYEEPSFMDLDMRDIMGSIIRVNDRLYLHDYSDVNKIVIRNIRRTQETPGEYYPIHNVLSVYEENITRAKKKYEIDIKQAEIIYNFSRNLLTKKLEQNTNCS